MGNASESHAEERRGSSHRHFQQNWLHAISFFLFSPSPVVLSPSPIAASSSSRLLLLRYVCKVPGVPSRFTLKTAYYLLDKLPASAYTETSLLTVGHSSSYESVPFSKDFRVHPIFLFACLSPSAMNTEIPRAAAHLCSGSACTVDIMNHDAIP
jgi:hypothetical protein